MSPPLVALALAGFWTQAACRPAVEPEPGPEDALFVEFTDQERGRIAGLTGLGAPPASLSNAVADDPDAAALGQWLYFDTRLSGNGEVACATCHDPEQGFGDGERLAEGVGTTDRHAPTVWNVAYQRWFFWDGRCDTLWCQASGPLEAPGEHGGDRLQFAHIVNTDAELRDAYEAIFGALPELDDADRFPARGRPVPDDPEDPLDVAWSGMDEADQHDVSLVFSNLTKAIAAYERLLITGPSPFDVFAEGLVEGDAEKLAALNEAEQTGLKLFINDNPANPFNTEVIEHPGAECYACHGGPELSDLEFHNVGLGPRDWLTWEDLGRYEGAQSVLENPFNGMGEFSDAPDAAENDKLVYLRQPDGTELGQFKTSTLRNVALHPPYMHGGHMDSLRDVVDFYADLGEPPVLSHRDEQLFPLDHLTDSDRDDLAVFLEALTGALPDQALLSAPDSPFSH